MKVKLNVHEGEKTFSITRELPNKEHLAAQIKFPKIVYRDRTVYTRKPKHKKSKGEQNDDL